MKKAVAPRSAAPGSRGDRAGGSTRRHARELLFRVAYQADLLREPCRDAWARLRDAERLGPEPLRLVEDVIAALDRHAAEIDGELRSAAEHWELDRLAATDRSVLRAAVAELMSRPGTPARVVLDEAIEIAKRYGSGASGGFVNGVLDRVARHLRAAEF